MKRFIAVAGAAIVFSCAASAASAQDAIPSSAVRGWTPMRFGTMSAPIAFRSPGIPWLPSSLRNLPPVQKEKPNPGKAEEAVNSAGSIERYASSQESQQAEPPPDPRQPSWC